MLKWFLSIRSQRNLARVVQEQGEAIHQISLQLRQLREHLELTAGQLNKVRGMITGGLHSVSKRETGAPGSVQSVPFGDKDGLRRVAGLDKPRGRKE